MPRWHRALDRRANADFCPWGTAYTSFVEVVGAAGARPDPGLRLRDHDSQVPHSSGFQGPTAGICAFISDRSPSTSSWPMAASAARASGHDRGQTSCSVVFHGPGGTHVDGVEYIPFEVPDGRRRPMTTMRAPRQAGSQVPACWRTPRSVSPNVDAAIRIAEWGPWCAFCEGVPRNTAAALPAVADTRPGCQPYGVDEVPDLDRQLGTCLSPRAGAHCRSDAQDVSEGPWDVDRGKLAARISACCEMITTPRLRFRAMTTATIHGVDGFDRVRTRRSGERACPRLPGSGVRGRLPDRDGSTTTRWRS